MNIEKFLRKYKEDALNVTVADEAVLLDMDTLEDYRRLVQHSERHLFPSLDDSISILREIQIHHPVRQHCYVVGALAFLLTGLLNRAGAGLNDGLVRAAAMLHDVARHEKDHARFGADLLKAWGYPLVAEIIASHMDMEVSQEEPLSEAEVVFLADKMVDGEKVISLNERFGSRLANIKNNPIAEKALHRRREQARQIKRKAEKLLERSVEEFQTEDLNSILKEWKV